MTDRSETGGTALASSTFAYRRGTGHWGWPTRARVPRRCGLAKDRRSFPTAVIGYHGTLLCVSVPIGWMDAFIDVPAEFVEAASAFWSAVSGWPPGDPWVGHPEFVSLEPPAGTAYLHVQTISGPPRVHLDLAGNLDRDVERLEALGATRGWRGERWQAMASPAGLTFCVYSASSPTERPGAATWPGGHRSRLAQVCIDVPADRFDIEFAFWRAATGWTEEALRLGEFRRLVHRPNSPLRLLLQRLGDDDGAAEARAHLDLGTDDIAAEVARVEELGAQVLWPGDGFVALRDPTGLPFCVTGNDPDR